MSKFNWQTATKKEVWEHKQENYNGRAKIAAMLSKVDTAHMLEIPDYIVEDTDTYSSGGVLLVNGKNELMFINNHLTMKDNLSISWFKDEPMPNGEWTQKEYVLSKLKGVDFDLGDEVKATYGIIPKLSEEQEAAIVLGTVASDAYDSQVNVYMTELFCIDLLVHIVEDKVYFVEELPEEATEDNGEEEEL